MLALGVGANLAEFHVLDVGLLHRLNIAGADTIYHLSRSSKDFGARSFPHPAAELFRKNCSRCAFAITEGIAWNSAILESAVPGRLQGRHLRRGAWFMNKGIRAGYEVVRVPVDNGQATASMSTSSPGLFRHRRMCGAVPWALRSGMTARSM